MINFTVKIESMEFIAWSGEYKVRCTFFESNDLVGEYTTTYVVNSPLKDSAG